MGVDNTLVKGYLRSKLWFGFKITANTVKKLLKAIDKGGKTLNKQDTFIFRNLFQYFTLKLFHKRMKIIMN